MYTLLYLQNLKGFSKILIHELVRRYYPNYTDKKLRLDMVEISCKNVLLKSNS